MGLRELRHLVHVDAPVLAPDPVVSHMEQPARLIRRRAVTQVATHRQTHAENAIARRQQRLVHGLVGLTAGVGLHIGVTAGEQAAGAVRGEPFQRVGPLGAAEVTTAGVALDGLVGEDRSLRLEHRAADEDSPRR